jgi:hypothetical protein
MPHEHRRPWLKTLHFSNTINEFFGDIPSLPMKNLQKLRFVLTQLAEQAYMQGVRDGQEGITEMRVQRTGRSRDACTPAPDARLHEARAVGCRST